MILQAHTMGPDVRSAAGGGVICLERPRQLSTVSRLPEPRAEAGVDVMYVLRWVLEAYF